MFVKRGGEKDGRYRWLYPMRILPLCNFFYDLFMDDSPINRESVKSLLDILGLINALLLTTVLSMITSLDYEAVIETDERYSGVDGKLESLNLKKYWDTWYDLPPSVLLQLAMGRSSVFLFVCLLMIIFVYADSLAKNPGDGTDEAPEEKRSNQVLYYKWWNYAKWAVFLCFFLTVVGIIYAVMAVQTLMYFKYPDYYIMVHGFISWSEPMDSVGDLSATFRVTFGAAALIAFLSCGAGTAAKYSTEDDDMYHVGLIERIEELEKGEASEGKQELYTLYQDLFHLLVALDYWLELQGLHEKMTKLDGQPFTKFFSEFKIDVDEMRSQVKNVSARELEEYKDREVFIRQRVKQQYAGSVADTSKRVAVVSGETDARRVFPE